jgi:DNA segregation ATPase FtsK/SpoIIIE, S-DNA-T family
MVERSHVNRIVFACFGLGVCLFIFASLFSFNIYDWPNPDVAPARPEHNLCGPVGAYLAYQNNYYLGPAGAAFLMAMAIWLVLHSMQRPIEQVILRITGVILFGSALSAGAYLINHGNAQSLSHGNGGVLGIALGHFLLNNTALTGAILVLTATAIVGLLLAADNIVLLLPKLLLQTLERLRKAGPVLAGVSVRAGGITARTRQTGLAVVKRAITVAAPPYKSDRPAEMKALKEPQEDEYEEEFEEESQSEDSETRIIKPQKPVFSALAQMIHPVVKFPICPAGANVEDYEDYSYPPLELLEEPVRGFASLQEKVVKERSKVLEQTLKEFNLEARVVEAETGPVITMFELELAPGIKVSQITNLANDMARSLGAPAVRVVAPIPGKHTIGIEVPNSEKETVRIKELLQLSGDKPGKMKIPLFLGKDASGNALTVDLTDMPHLLIAGTTGSGKSICINSIITSIMLTQRPDMIKLILVDPKMVEMTAFRDMPHLMCPVVTEMKRAEQILQWLTEKMDERYALMAEARVRNIANYNKLTEEEIYERFSPGTEEEKAKVPLRLPYIVIIIDELADLMMTSAKEVESYIIRLAQKSRAVGIHIVLATQRPQATVVTGLIKSNLPCRISFRVAARMDSRIVLDQNGAETLLGQGDMLFLQPGTSNLIRSQGTFVSDKEVNDIVKFLREEAQPNYHPELVQMNHIDTGDMERDELFDDAVRMVLETKRGSVSLLQRRLTIGYSRASRLIDQMAIAGIVGEYKGSQAREVLISLEEYKNIRRQMEHDAVTGYEDLQDKEEEEEPEQDDNEEQDDEIEDELEEEEEGEEDGEEEEYEEEEKNG